MNIGDHLFRMVYLLPYGATSPDNMAQAVAEATDGEAARPAPKAMDRIGMPLS